MIGTFTFGGTGRQVNAYGQSFRYERGNSQGNDVGIRVRADGQDLGVFEPGDNMVLPMAASRWDITPVSTFLTGTVRIGPASMSTSRISGEVSIAPSTFKSAMQNRAFSANYGLVSMLTNSIEAQIWNPAGTSKAIIVTQVHHVMSDTSPSAFFITTVQAPTIFGSAFSKRNGSAHGTVGATFEFRHYPAGVAPGAITGLIWQAQSQAYATVTRSFSEPAIIYPGSGFSMRGLTFGVAGISYNCQCEFLEVPLSEL